MSADEFQDALDDIERKTAHLSDEEFHAEIDGLVQEVRALRPAPSEPVVFTNSATFDAYDVSLIEGSVT